MIQLVIVAVLCVQVFLAWYILDLWDERQRHREIIDLFGRHTRYFAKENINQEQREMLFKGLLKSVRDIENR